MEKYSYFEVKRKIALLKKLSANNVGIELYKPHIHVIANDVIFRAITMKNNTIYRSRWNLGHHLFKKVEEINYPKEQYVTRKGRFNEIGESIFYGATSELGTIIEARPELNKLFTISQININLSNLIVFPLAIKKHQDNSKILSNREKSVIDFLYNEITKIVNGPEEYNSTIAIGRFFLKTPIEKAKHVSCVAYPSIEGGKISSTTTYNIAALPEVADQCFKFKSAKVYCLTFENSHYQVNPVNETVAITEDYELIWKYSKDQMMNRINEGLCVGDHFCENIKKITD